MRYSGSLLKYSFGEATQKKGAILVDLDGTGQAATTFLPLRPRRDVRIITGRFEDILQAEDEHHDDYILARLDDTRPILDGMAKLRHKYPNALALEAPIAAWAIKPVNAISIFIRLMTSSFSPALLRACGFDEGLTRGRKGLHRRGLASVG